MKHTFTLVASAVLIFVGTTSLKKPQRLSVSYSESNYKLAVRITETQFNNLTAAYQVSSPTASLGGKIGKAELLELIDNMGSGKDYVHMRICSDNLYNSTSLMFAGEKGFLQSASHSKYLRNGGSGDAFCPLRCEIQNSATVSVALTQKQYDSLSAAFPGGPIGGDIDKAALQEICNSLPPASNTVSFRFCKDPSTQSISVIFVGGTANGQTLYLRNAGAAAFCPNSCN